MGNNTNSRVVLVQLEFRCVLFAWIKSVVNDNSGQAAGSHNWRGSSSFTRSHGGGASPIPWCPGCRVPPVVNQRSYFHYFKKNSLKHSLMLFSFNLIGGEKILSDWWTGQSNCWIGIGWFFNLKKKHVVTHPLGVQKKMRVLATTNV